MPDGAEVHRVNLLRKSIGHNKTGKESKAGILI
jgi:hypothetical protein